MFEDWNMVEKSDLLQCLAVTYQNYTQAVTVHNIKMMGQLLVICLLQDRFFTGTFTSVFFFNYLINLTKVAKLINVV